MSYRDVRVAAIGLMCQLDGQHGSLTSLLPKALDEVEPSQRSHLQALAFGLSRWSQQGSALLTRLLEKPLKRKDADVVWLLKLGLFQLMHTRMPAHAAVDETVKVTRKLDKPWARGLVNGVLRNFQRNQTSLLASLDVAERLSHPDWLMARFRQDWPEQVEAIAEANNRQAPMTLRVHAARQSREAWIRRLHDSVAEVVATPSAFAADALTLSQPLPVHQLPGFEQGDVSVQDAAAQLSADLLARIDSAAADIATADSVPTGGALAESPGDGRRARRLLDACAAPGGKTAHALERGDFDHVVALDNDAERLQRVEQTLTRLGLSSAATLHHADAGDPQQWWDGTAFEAILIDAPCSGTGVIRRHPDIKQLRRDSDIEGLVARQSRLLDALWPLLQPGGVLLYCTCSILKIENEEQITAFLRRTDDAGIDLPQGDWGRLRPGIEPVGRQILPDEHGMDGFFHARLIKQH